MVRRKAAHGDRLVTGVNSEEGADQHHGSEGLGFVRFDGEGVVGCVEHLGEGDEVEEERDDGGGDGDAAPTGPVIQGRRQDRECGDAVADNSDSKPEKGHESIFGARANCPKIQVYRAFLWLCCAVPIIALLLFPPAPTFMPKSSNEIA
jgi:hypothetical protein